VCHLPDDPFQSPPELFSGELDIRPEKPERRVGHLIGCASRLENLG